MLLSLASLGFFVLLMLISPASVRHPIKLWIVGSLLAIGLATAATYVTPLTAYSIPPVSSLVFLVWFKLAMKKSWLNVGKLVLISFSLAGVAIAGLFLYES